MSRVIATSRILGSIHDLSTLQGLSDDPCNVLFVSDRTMYLLANYARDDVTFFSRYVLDYINASMVRVADQDDPEYNDIVRIIEAFQSETAGNDMAIEQGLNAIAQAIIASACCQGSGQGGGTGGSDGSETTASDGIDNGSSPPTTGDWPTYGDYEQYKCSIANFVVDTLDENINTLRSVAWSSVLALPTAEIILILAATLATPIPGDEIIAFAAVLSIWGGAFEPLFNDFENAVDNARSELVCALYESGDVGQAKGDFQTALDAAIDAEVSTGLANFVIKGMSRLWVTNDNLNKLFTEDTSREYPVGSVDCSACNQSAVGIKFQLGINGLPRGSGDLSPDGLTRTLSSQPDDNGFHYITFGVYATPSQDSGFNDCSFIPASVVGTPQESFDALYPNSITGILQGDGYRCTNQVSSGQYGPGGPLLNTVYEISWTEFIGNAPFTVDVQLSNF